MACMKVKGRAKAKCCSFYYSRRLFLIVCHSYLMQSWLIGYIYNVGVVTSQTFDLEGLLWRTNIDMQFVAESLLALANYVSDYVMKAEKSNMQELWQEVGENQSIYSKLRNLCQKIV